MKISVITATYNSASSILECLDSLTSQTHDVIEHLIVDGGSSDQTLSLVRNFPERGSTTRRIIEGPDNGIYDALNKGILSATGEVISILHSDDLFFSPHTLQQVKDNFEKENVDGVYGNLVFTDQNEKDRIIRYWKSSAFNIRNLNFGWAPPHPALFLHKEVYLKYGLFDTDYTIAGDYDFMLRIFRKRELKFHFLDQPLVRMRMGGVSTFGLRNLLRKSHEDFKVLKKNQMPFPLWTLGMKIGRKIPQFMATFP
jgi:glycosyltransferase involved in cell wall biosynthesis